MKKSFVLFLLPFLLPLSFSCQNNNKISTMYAINDLSKRGSVEIHKDKLDSLMENKQTFIFAQTTRFCSCSDSFINIVDQYAKRDGMIIYRIDYEEIDTKYGFSVRDNAPTFHFVRQGVHLANLEQIDKGVSNEFFTNYETFERYIDEHVNKPHMYYVSDEELSALYSKNDKFIVYFAKSKCIECEYLSNVIINEYAQNNFDMKKMYVIDLANYADDQSKFDEIRIKYGLNETSNPTWGYFKGAIPIIQYVDPSKNHSLNNSVEQSYMFGNDIIDKNTLKVIYSYYNSERVKNINYSKINSRIGIVENKDNCIDNDGAYTLNNTTNEKYYKSTFIDFMNYLKDKII